ncbi:MAG: N-acetylmuramoyl-L-alanine amidase [Dorea sp.]|nr:N-acetylmuramoyl-L-alanine amidase [uncultured Dorea sp.]
MRRKIELMVLLLILAGLLSLSKNLQKYVSSENVVAAGKVIVIDSGHGGDDPGKIGINQAKEKDVNLKIAKKVKKRLKKEGWKVVMTREEDVMLGDAQKGNRKIHDMKARVELINKTMPAMAVSIHQNSYQEAEIHGAQVFYYSHSQDGKRMAETMQRALLMADEENTRQAKGNDTYYLLKRTEVPTIIVECGFLSNPQEAEKLTEDGYQKKLAQAITSGIIACVGN